MKIAFIVLVSLHALIHLLGFVKAFRPGSVKSIKKPITAAWGIAWLVALLLFLVFTVLVLLDNAFWWAPAFAAVLLSQWVIIHSWSDAKFGTIANVLIFAASLIGFGTWNFYAGYQARVEKSFALSTSAKSGLLSEADISQLPEVVRKYIRYTGSIGKPKVDHFKVEFSGKIRQDAKSEWMPFTSEQYNFVQNPTRLFFMKAVMKRMPVAGFHCFADGKASMDIRLLSLFKVQYQDGKEMDQSETVTFFNDMCCMAPATLIDKRIRWIEANSTQALARFTHNGITISARLFFNQKGELINFISEDRYAAGENDTMKKYRWSTPVKNYREINGYRLPAYAEAIYSYPEGDFCYGEFNLTGVEYNR